MNTLRVLVAVLLAAFPAAASHAQTAPEGNAHPQAMALSESRDLPSPFGEHNTDPSKVISAAEKAAFAAQVNLDCLRGLAVFHGGRVKVLGTLAGETVEQLAGRRTYVDYVRDPKAGNVEGIRDVKYDPVFTLLDMTIDPGYYLDKPLLGIEYLPLRRAILETKFKDDEAAQKRWLRVGRITPLMVDEVVPEVAQAHMSEEPFRAALGRLDDSIGLFLRGKSNYLMVAPSETDLPWQHLSQLPEDSPARRAAADLGDAWRARDAGRVNAAAIALAAELPKINASVYPGAKRAMETWYNRSHAFEIGFWVYAFSLVCLLLAFGTGRRWLVWAGGVLLAVALATHAGGFITRCLIAERFAIQNQFESMTGLSLFAVAVGLALMLMRRQWLFGAAAAAVGFLVLLTATQAPIPGKHIGREAAILNTSVLLKYHVTTVLSSYGLIALGFVLSLFYLGCHYLVVERSPVLAGDGGGSGGVSLALGDDRGVIGTRARLLADLDTAQMIVLQLAFWTLGVGILLGAWWADHSWGRWWAFDPKETWALITWIVYLVVIHVRIAAPRNKAFTTAWLSIVGFVVMLWTYFGVNLLLPGLHAYA